MNFDYVDRVLLANAVEQVIVDLKLTISEQECEYDEADPDLLHQLDEFENLRKKLKV